MEWFLMATIREWLWRTYFRTHVISKKTVIGKWHTLTSSVGVGRDRLFRREERLQQAYYNLFEGKPSSEDQQIVLVDLLRVTGFNRAHGPKVSDQVLRYQEGKRAVFAHIFSYLRLSDEDVSTLAEAARQEQVLHEQNYQEELR